jgi:hypothetical protein
MLDQRPVPTSFRDQAGGDGPALESLLRDGAVNGNPNAALSPAELESLRCLANRRGSLVPADDKIRFIAMKFVGCDADGELVLTELAWLRLEAEVRKSWERRSHARA